MRTARVARVKRAQARTASSARAGGGRCARASTARARASGYGCQVGVGVRSTVTVRRQVSGWVSVDSASGTTMSTTGDDGLRSVSVSSGRWCTVRCGRCTAGVGVVDGCRARCTVGVGRSRSVVTVYDDSRRCRLRCVGASGRRRSGRRRASGASSRGTASYGRSVAGWRRCYGRLRLRCRRTASVTGVGRRYGRSGVRRRWTALRSTGGFGCRRSYGRSSVGRTASVTAGVDGRRRVGSRSTSASSSGGDDGGRRTGHGRRRVGRRRCRTVRQVGRRRQASGRRRASVGVVDGRGCRVVGLRDRSATAGVGRRRRVGRASVGSASYGSVDGYGCYGRYGRSVVGWCRVVRVRLRSTGGVGRSVSGVRAYVGSSRVTVRVGAGVGAGVGRSTVRAGAVGYDSHAYGSVSVYGSGRSGARR